MKKVTAATRSTAFRRELPTLFSAERAWSAAQIKDRFPNIDLSTVYRNLQRLVSSGDLRETRFGTGEAYYEPAARPHHAHLLCENCAAAECVPCPVTGLKTVHELQLFGRCADCAKRA